MYKRSSARYRNEESEGIEKDSYLLFHNIFSEARRTIPTLGGYE